MGINLLTGAYNRTNAGCYSWHLILCSAFGNFARHMTVFGDFQSAALQLFSKSRPYPTGHSKLRSIHNTYIFYIVSSGWWYTYPSEKYEFVRWDCEIPNQVEKKHVPNHQSVNFQIIQHHLMGKSTINIYKLPFSIATLVYQRVTNISHLMGKTTINCHFQSVIVSASSQKNVASVITAVRHLVPAETCPTMF